MTYEGQLINYWQDLFVIILLNEFIIILLFAIDLSWEGDCIKNDIY